ncbi:hypothetical protein BBJ28_00023320, partial [Nothophytophthora sp. Chile5]
MPAKSSRRGSRPGRKPALASTKPPKTASLLRSTCCCGVERRMEPKTGFTNLLGHIFMWHTNFVAEMMSASANTGTLVGFIDDKTHKIFSWIDMVLSCNLPFSFCETQAASVYVKIGSLAVLVFHAKLLADVLLFQE